jgi:hypothetical protein
VGKYVGRSWFEEKGGGESGEWMTDGWAKSYHTWRRRVYYDLNVYICAILAFLWMSMELLYKRDRESSFVKSRVESKYISHKNIRVKTSHKERNVKEERK